jgi:hypothetical protein
MTDKEVIIKITVDFEAWKAPFNNFDDIAKMMAAFIERDFVVQGVTIKSSNAFVEAIGE